MPVTFLQKLWWQRRRYTRNENRQQMRLQRKERAWMRSRAGENEEEQGVEEDPRWCYWTLPCTLQFDVRVHGKVVRSKRPTRGHSVGENAQPPTREVPDPSHKVDDELADTIAPGKIYSIAEMAEHQVRAAEEATIWDDLRTGSPAMFTAYLVQVTADANTGSTPVQYSERDGLEEGFEQPEIRVGEDPSVFTRMTDLHNPRRVAAVLNAVTIGPDLSREQREEVHAFITEFTDCYALSMKEAVPIPGAEHTMNIPTNTTFNTKVHQRPTTPAQKLWYNSVIDEMLNVGIITGIDVKDVKCVSPTTLAQKAHQNGKTRTILELQHQINDQCIAAGLPPSFVLPERPAMAPEVDDPKKPLWRVCHNYRELNSKTKVAAMPQGNIQRKQGLLSGHRWITVFDFAKGFYVCATAEEIRPYLCFYVEGRGYFTYCKMPMGLTGALSTFSTATGGALRDLVGTKIQLFVDDGGMVGDNFRAKMDDLRTVFLCVREHKLSLSASKMQFFMTEATFAGNWVGPEGIKPDLTKLTAILDWETPYDLLNLKSFLGLCGHFRGLIKNYARIAQPLTDLERLAKVGGAGSKGEWWRRMWVVELWKQWGEKQQVVFVKLKAALTSEPVLKGLVFNGRPFIVTTDGSKEVFGGMLCQRFDTVMPDGRTVNRLHPIGFASKRTSLAEERYKPYLLEFTALKYSLDKFTDTTYGFPIEIETDCQALRNTVMSTNLSTTHARLGLQPVAIFDGSTDGTGG
jgi:hypothetical protein